MSARLGQDVPPRGPAPGAARQEFVAQVLSDLHERGVAVLQGPSASGTGRAAAATATAWPRSFGWSRAGLWTSLYDLGRPAWEGTPAAALLGEATEAAVDSLLAELRRTGRLLVIDACDAALRPPPSPAEPLDAELAVLVAALEAGELAGSGGAVLFAGRRAPAGLHVPVRPMPRLTRAEAGALAGRDPAALPEPLLRRPGLLALLPGLPGLDPAVLGDEPLVAAVTAACAVLTHPEREVLLTLAITDHPLPAWGLGEAAGLERPTVDAALERLTELRLASPREHGWRCPRAIAPAVRRIVPGTLKGVLPSALAWRAAAFWLRQGSDPNRTWASADDAFPARLGLRCALLGNSGRMAVQALLYGGTSEQLERMGALRPLRDDLAAALSQPDGDLPPLDRARAAYALARVCRRLADPTGARAALQQAARALEGADPDRGLEGAIHRDLGRELLLGGSPEHGLQHLERARVLSGSPPQTLDVELLVGAARLRLGQLEAAAQAFGRGLDAAAEAGVKRGELACLEGLAAVDFKRGRLKEAEQALLDLLERGPSEGDPPAHRRANLCRVRLARGDLPGARAVLEDAFGTTAGLSHRTRARLLVLRARLRWLAGDLEGAEADVDSARADVAAVGDREGEADRASVRAGVLRARGQWADAVSAAQWALDADGELQERASVVVREAALAHAQAWEAAATWRDTGDLDPLQDAVRRADDALAELEREPFFARWLAVKTLVTEAELLLAAAAGTPPLGHHRALERLREEALEHDQRGVGGEASLALLSAWAQALCGQDAGAAAGRARVAAEDSGLAGVAAMARALQGDATADHAPARLMAELLAPRP